MNAHAATAVLADVSVIGMDIFGTTVDSRTSVDEQIAQIAGPTSAKVSPGRLTDER